MHHYHLSKLSIINYRMAVHEGTANRRLASQAAEILFIPPSDVPDLYRFQFEKLQTIINATLDEIHLPGLNPIRLIGIQNRTAAKYLKLLIEIEEELRSADY